FDVADFDGDGNLDIEMSAHSGFSTLLFFIFWGDGHGHFTQVLKGSTVIGDVALAGYDFDGDGAADILSTDPFTGATRLTSARGRILVTTTIDASPAVGGPPSRFVGAGDLDDDGLRDALFENGTVVWGHAPG